MEPRRIPKEILLPILIRTKIASVLGCISFSVNLKECKLYPRSRTSIPSLLGFLYLFFAIIKTGIAGFHVAAAFVYDGEVSASYSTALSNFAFYMFATFSHIEICHLHSNDYIVLFNSIKFQRILRARKFLKNVKSLVRECRRLGPEAFVVFIDPIVGGVYVLMRAYGSIMEPEDDRTRLFSNLPEMFKVSAFVLPCAVFDIFVSHFMMVNAALAIVPALLTRMAYYEPLHLLLSSHKRWKPTDLKVICRRIHHHRTVATLMNSTFRTFLSVAKAAALSISISGTYYYLENFQKKSLTTFTEIFMAVCALFYYQFPLRRMHIASESVKMARYQLRPCFHFILRDYVEYGLRRELVYARKSVECARDVKVRELTSEFTKVSLIMFVDTYLQRVIGLLIANETS